MTSQPIKVSSTKIRDAIGALCQFFSLSGFSPISPETLRQAKFNKMEAVGQLLKLLAELLEFSTSWKILTSSELREDSLVYAVHSGMLTRRYKRPQFYSCLDLTAPACQSSRELLLAIGWLISKEKLLRRLFLKESVGLRSFPDMPHKFLGKEEANCANQEMELAISLEEHLNRLLWKIGRCRMATKQLYWKQREIARLAHKIHTSTQGTSLAKNQVCLSPSDVYVLRYKDKLRKHLEILEKENKRLQIYFQWMEKEEIFWQWMETVFDTDKLDPSQEEHMTTGSHLDYDHCLNDSWRILDDCSNQLEESFKDVAQRVQYYGSAIVASNPTKTSIQQSDGRGQDVVGDSEALHDGTSGYLLDLQDIRFEFVPNKVKGHSSSKTQVHSQPDLSLVEEVRDIKEEILILSKRLRTLETSLSEQRDSYSSLCSDVLSSVNGVVSISPISSNQR